MSSNPKVAGVDEAGRGAVIGPLVIAAVSISSDLLPVLEDVGVRDSKRLSPIRRMEIFEQLLRMPMVIQVEIIQPREIDSYVRVRGGLGMNELEAAKIGKLISLLDASEVYVDSPTRPPDRFKKCLERHLDRKVKIVCENKADERWIVVGAASIVAKVERDRWITELNRLHGPLGSGYPSDPETMRFLGEYLRRDGDRSGLVRRSWRCVRRIRQ